MKTFRFFSVFFSFCLVVYIYATVKAPSVPRENSPAEKLKLDVRHPFEVSDVSVLVTEFGEYLVSGFVELFSPVAAYGEEMSSKKADDGCKGRMCQCVDKELRQAMSSFFVYLGSGIGIAVLILRLFYGSFF